MKVGRVRWIVVAALGVAAIGATVFGLIKDRGEPGTQPDLADTTVLTDEDLEAAKAIAFEDDVLVERLGDHRYRVVEWEECEGKLGDCWRFGIFDYDAGVCLHVPVYPSSRSVDR